MSSARAGGPLFIITGKAGQLGNRLFFSSYVMSLAAKLGGRVLNPSFMDFAGEFTGTREDFLGRWPARTSMFRARWIAKVAGSVMNFALRIANRLRLTFPGVKILGLHEGRTADYRLDNDAFLDSLRAARLVFIGGWLELKHVRFEQPDAIRAHFTPVERHRAAVTDLISRTRATCDVLIGVHIRQGDYAGFLGGRYFFPTEAYVRAMKNAAALFPGRRVGFLICSNTPQSISDPELPRIARGTGNAIEDMYSLAECDYLIGPPSTYSLWASFFGKVPLWEMHDATSAPKLDEFLIRF
jgi:hypothetical protein